MISKMMKFWNDNASNAADFPSINFWFKDGSMLGLYLQRRIYMDMPFPAYALAYSDYQGNSMEIPSVIPALRETKMKTDLSTILDMFVAKGLDIEKEIERVGYVI